MKGFKHKINIRWADCDANRHVRHSAYYDFAADVRIRFFASIGFDTPKMNALNIGPILFTETCSFIKEIKPNEIITVNFLKENISSDGSRWKLHHELFNKQEQKVAHITITGAWMDLSLRKLTIPPVNIAEAIKQLPLGSDYVYDKTKKAK